MGVIPHRSNHPVQYEGGVSAPGKSMITETLNEGRNSGTINYSQKFIPPNNEEHERFFISSKCSQLRD